MIRKIILYLLFFLPICKVFKVYTHFDNSKLKDNEIIITNKRCWMYTDEHILIYSSFDYKLSDFPDKFIVVTSWYKYYDYIHFIRRTLTDAFRKEIFDAYLTNPTDILINEYLEMNLLR